MNTAAPSDELVALADTLGLLHYRTIAFASDRVISDAVRSIYPASANLLRVTVAAMLGDAPDSDLVCRVLEVHSDSGESISYCVDQAHRDLAEQARAAADAEAAQVDNAIVFCLRLQRGVAVSWAQLATSLTDDVTITAYAAALERLVSSGRISRTASGRISRTASQRPPRYFVPVGV